MDQQQAVSPVQIKLDDEHHVVVVPEGWQVRDISDMLPPPMRIEQHVELLTLQAFLGYVGQYQELASTVFADENNAQYEAVLDYHAPGDATRGTCDHIARYTCPKADAWILWLGASGRQMSQTEFARFLEDNLPDVASPPSADLLQLVLKLQIKKAANFVSDVRLDNGQVQLRYEETIRNDTKSGDLTFPDSFTLGIPVFVDGARYAVKARLRYRLDEGKLRMWYELERASDVFRAAVKQVSEAVVKGLPNVSFWAGKRK